MIPADADQAPAVTFWLRYCSELLRSVLRARNRTRKSGCTALLVNHHDAAESHRKGGQESILQECVLVDVPILSPVGHCGLRVQVHCTLAGSIPAGHEKRILRWAGFNTPFTYNRCRCAEIPAPTHVNGLEGVLNPAQRRFFFS